MLGLPADDNMRCRLLLGLAVKVASCSKPIVALIRSRRIRRAVSGSPLRNKSSSFVEQRLRERRLALDPLDHGLLEITRQCHETHLVLLLAIGFTTLAFLRALYSASRALA